MITSGVRRIDVGGKLLSKLIAKMVTFKQFRMDGYIQTMTKMKERVCYVEDCCEKALKNLKKAKVFYVLPDPDIGREGYMTQEMDTTGVLQILKLSKERFLVPEALFRPQMYSFSQILEADLSKRALWTQSSTV